MMMNRCVMIALVTVLVFYLPSKSGEKVAFSVSTLLALTWFILLLSENIPPTSLVLPLLGKYLLFTLSLVTLSICNSVMVLYHQFHHPGASNISYWIRKIFIEILPPLLLLANDELLLQHRKQEMDGEVNGQQHSLDTLEYVVSLFARDATTDEATITKVRIVMDDVDRARMKRRRWKVGKTTTTISANNHSHNNNKSTLGSNGSKISKKSSPKQQQQQHNHNFYNNRKLQKEAIAAAIGLQVGTNPLQAVIDDLQEAFGEYMAYPEVRKAMLAIEFIARRYDKMTKFRKTKHEWELVSRVLDRLLLVLFTAASTLGTISILLRSPSLYDSSQPLGPSQIEAFIDYDQWNP